MDKYLSILTNFGCHYTCPYCIVKKNGIDIPKTTLAGLDGLDKAIKENDISIVSVSGGGGDPLYNYPEHADWYAKLFQILYENNIPLEMHTSYTQSLFYFGYLERVCFHISDPLLIPKIRREGAEKVRIVLVVTDDMTIDDIKTIALLVKLNPDIDELSFRQRVDENYEVSYHLHDFLKAGHKKDWWYIEQNDYNLYYVENEVRTQYKSFKKGE